jgi:SAM-dependent methyltransferase
MLTIARSKGFVTSKSEPVRFEVSTAEQLGSNVSPPVAQGSVDLITAGNAAHWFDMAGFWPSAARVLKPGGSVALWTSGTVTAHPSMPNAAAIQEAMDQCLMRDLEPFTVPGNLVARDSYRTLQLPWSLENPVTEFDEQTFYRKDWDLAEPFHDGEPGVDLDTFERMMGSSSAVVRWRQAHPDKVDTEGDLITMLRRQIARLLHEAGVKEGTEILKGAAHGAILIVKKRL